MNNPDLSTGLGPIELKNPVLTASGTAGYGLELRPFFDIAELGGIVTKAVTPEPRVGNPPPRLWETSCGLLNSIGLENVGLAAFLKDILPLLQKINTRVIVNVAGRTEDEYLEVVRGLNGNEGIAGLEINISCPNVKQGGIAFGTDPVMAAALIKKVRAATDYPLIAKLPPNVTDIVIIAERVMEAGADVVSLINTLKGLAVDVNTRKPCLATITGGLSGPAIKPVALRMVHEVYQALKIPILGGGGIMTADDALEFIICGAGAVSVGTAIFRDPKAPLNIAQGIKSYLAKNNIGGIRNLIGSIDLS